MSKGAKTDGSPLGGPSYSSKNLERAANFIEVSPRHAPARLYVIQAKKYRVALLNTSVSSSL